MKYPVLVTRGIVVLPGNTAVIEVGRETSLNAINAGKKDGKIILLSQRNPALDTPVEDDLFQVGSLAKFTIEKEWEDGSYKILVKSLERVKINKIELSAGCWNADVEILEDAETNIENIIDVFEKLLQSFSSTLNNIGITSSHFEQFKQSENPGKIIDLISGYIPLTLNKKQMLLEEINPIVRVEIILEETSKQKTVKQTDISEKDIDNDITKKVNDRLTKQQREFFLRERLKAIKEELGDISNKDDEIETIRNKVKTDPYPEHIKEKVLAELQRFENTPAASAESNIIKNYIDWLVGLPWWQKSKDNNNIKKAREILDTNHYGLEKVKDRIIEFLAVKAKSGGINGPIICLVGPPGVGKTSLAHSIAQSLNKKFIKISLGGTKDESEIRGHRRTYLGSLPGRIIQGMKKAKVINPLILLDEIDKMDTGQRGDPSSAMLEVLDPSQNKNFSDNFIEEEYDLSKVLFITTANYAQNIPAPLYDRMEIINLTSYTESEKMHIAKNHLLPKVFDEVGLKKTELKIPIQIIEHIIKRYTRESGVRTLQRTIHQIARKFIVKQLKGEIKTQTVTLKILREYLGKEIYDYNTKDKKPIIGVVTGLAWTQFGGDTLPIEVSYYPGKGGIMLTGQQKDVMKESANIALSYVKAHAKEFKIDPAKFAKTTLHIHVPDGSTPKDGPSAGVTFTTAIISAFSGRAISEKIGMTGEISLVGKVMRIGGLKEKSISAVRSGLDTILIPKENLRDIKDIPEETRQKLKIIPVSHYTELYKYIFRTTH